MRTIGIQAGLAIIAIVASVFAMWSVVADAPWEEGVVAVPTLMPLDRTRELRCEGAYGLRDAIIIAGPYVSEYVPREGSSRRARSGNIGGVRNYTFALANAEAEIDRYC